jgi:thiol:disulfide interchange protein
MKRAVSGFALLAFVCGLAGMATAGEILWAKSYEAGLARVRAEKKPVMIDLYTDWCGWCKKLDEDVYPNESVAALSKAFVCIKLNPEKDKKNGKKFKVEGFPTIIFLNTKGEEINRIGGYLPAPKFAEEMKKALTAAGVKASAKESGKGKEEDVEN